MTPVSVLALAVHSGTPVRIAPALKRVTLQMSILDNKQNIPMTYKDYLRYRSLKDSPEWMQNGARFVEGDNQCCGAGLECQKEGTPGDMTKVARCVPAGSAKK